MYSQRPQTTRTDPHFVFLHNGNWDIQRRWCHHLWRNVLLVQRRIGLIDRRKSWLWNNQWNLILRGNLRRIVQPLGHLLNILQGFLLGSLTTMFSTSRRRVLVNASKRGFHNAPPAEIVPHTLYLGAKNLTLIHQDLDVVVMLVLGPPKGSQCSPVSFKASTMPIPSGHKKSHHGLLVNYQVGNHPFNASNSLLQLDPLLQTIPLVSVLVSHQTMRTNTWTYPLRFPPYHGLHLFNQHCRIPHRPGSCIYRQIKVWAQIDQPHTKLLKQDPISGWHVNIPSPFWVAKPSDAPGPDLVVVCQHSVLKPINWGVFIEQQFSQNLYKNGQP